MSLLCQSQGLTLDEASMNLSRCFADGQAYVALSRVTDMQGKELVSEQASKDSSLFFGILINQLRCVYRIYLADCWVAIDFSSISALQDWYWKHRLELGMSKQMLLSLLI